MSRKSAKFVFALDFYTPCGTMKMAVRRLFSANAERIFGIIFLTVKGGA